MPKQGGRGGPRRNKVPDIDVEHLLDILNGYVRKVGVKHAFCFGKYHNLTREQAVVASSLCDMEDLVADLHKVSHSLEFKYSDLKTGLKETLKQYPGIVERFPVEEQSDLSSKLSESILVICNRCRRLSRQPSKFQEACSKASDFQVGKLERMKTLLVPEPPDPKSPGLPVKASKKAKKTPASPKCGSPTSVKTEDLLNMDIPATQSSLGGSLLDEAMGTEPIPVRKAVLREAIAQKKPAAKRPAASAEAVPSEKKNSKGNGTKKPQVADDACFADHKLKLMPYNQTGAMAIRIDKGPQLIQIKSKQGAKQSKALAEKLLAELKNGMSLGDAKAWKAARLAKEK